MGNIRFLILILLNYLLISCTPAKVDFSASQLNNLKYIFTNSVSQDSSISLHPGETSSLDFKTSDKIGNSLKIFIRYQVISPENTDISVILDNYKTEEAIALEAKNFILPLQVKTNLPFTTNAELKISLSSEDDSVEFMPSEYKLKIINAQVPPPTPEVTFNALNYVNLLNKTAYLVSGNCQNLTQFSLRVSTLSFSATCSGNFWSKLVDLHLLDDGTLTVKAMSSDETVLYQTTTVIKDTIPPSVGAVNDSSFYNSTTETPMFSWSGTDATSGIQKYEIALGSTNSLQDKYPWTNINLVTSKQLTGLSLSDGSTYYVQVRATDMAGNISNAVAGDGYAVNTSMPVAILNNLPNSSTNVGTFSIAVSGTSIVEYSYKYGISSSTDCNNMGDYSVSTLVANPITGYTPSANTYKVCVLGKNAAGTWQTVATSYTWTFDDIPPVLSITTPLPGTYVNLSNYASYSVTSNCSENAMTVYFKAESQTNTTLNTSGSIACSAGVAISNLNLTSLLDGNVDIKTWQQDAAGNIGYSSVVTVIKDVAAPVLSGTPTASSSYSNNSSASPLIDWAGVTLTETGSGLAFYKISIGTSAGGSNIQSWTPIGVSTSNTVTGLSLSDGTYYANIEAKDNAGNFSNYVSASWTVDTTFPAVVITSPPSGGYITTGNQSSITLSANCESGLMVNFVVVSLVAGTFTNNDSVICSAGTASTNFNVSTYPEGNIRFSVSQTDLAGNNRLVSRDLLKDTIAPTISGSVSDGIYFNSLSDSPILTWSSASEAGSGISNYQIRIGTNGGGGEIIDWTSIGNVTSYQLHTLSLTEGTIYYPSIRAVDIAGNISAVIYGDGWMPDTQIPVSPSMVNDGDQSTALTSSTAISWSLSFDSASGVAAYEVRLVQNVGSAEVVGWTNVGLNLSHTFNSINPSLSVENVYHAEVRAVDNAGNRSNVSVGDGWLIVPSGWKAESFLKAANAEAGDNFGSSIAVDGDTVVVGAYAEDSSQTIITNGSGTSADNTASGAGAVYVYKRSWNNSLKKYEWSQEAYLKAPNADALDTFGNSIAISGDTIAVGAYGEDSSQTTITNGSGASADNTASTSGAVYVFKRSGVTWSQEAYLKAPNAEANDFFGYKIAIAEDTIVVGAYGEDSSQTTITNGSGASADNIASNAGAVYVFKRSGVTWSQEAYLKAPNAEAGDQFGFSVAISGDTIAVGAYGEDSSQTTITNGSGASADNIASTSGAVYVFKRSGVTWSQEAYLKAPNAEAGDQFGFSVAISGETIVVGAPFEDNSSVSIINGSSVSSNNIASNAGAVYVFQRSGVTWSHEAYLKAPNAESLDQFGFDVSISGDVIAVGANLEDSSQTTITNGSSASADNTVSSAGAVYVFQRGGGAWSHLAYIKAPNAGTGDSFGKFVGLSNNTLVVGVPQEDSSVNYIQNESTLFIYNDDALDSGAGYIFKFDP